MLRRAERTPIRIDNGGFIATPNMPGWVDATSKDHGLGPLAMIVRSVLDPGRQIAMHEHRDDEIISWVPAGVMRHDDRAGGKLLIDRDHLMVMNAGRSFWHAEETHPGDPTLDMLQILVRPRAPDLEPLIQFGPVPAAAPNVWRHLVGAEGGDAPFFVRNAVDLYDIRLDRGAEVAFPSRPGHDLYFYVFSGALNAAGMTFAAAEQGLLRGGGALTLAAAAAGITVAFLVNPSAPVSRTGTIGDNPRIPHVWLFRALRLWRKLRPR